MMLLPVSVFPVVWNLDLCWKRDMIAGKFNMNKHLTHSDSLWCFMFQVGGYCILAQFSSLLYALLLLPLLLLFLPSGPRWPSASPFSFLNISYYPPSFFYFLFIFFFAFRAEVRLCRWSVPKSATMKRQPFSAAARSTHAVCTMHGSHVNGNLGPTQWMAVPKTCPKVLTISSDTMLKFRVWQFVNWMMYLGRTCCLLGHKVRSQGRRRWFLGV